MRWKQNSSDACTDANTTNAEKASSRRPFPFQGQLQPGPGNSRGRKPRGTCDRGRLRRPREPLACGLDVRSLLALRALRDFELDFLSFLERFEPAHLNRGEVRKQILAAVIRGYKPITLCIIEPLHRTCWHRAFLNFRTGELSLCLYFNAAEEFQPANRMEDKHREAFYALWAAASSAQESVNPLFCRHVWMLRSPATAITL